VSDLDAMVKRNMLGLLEPTFRFGNAIRALTTCLEGIVYRYQSATRKVGRGKGDWAWGRLHTGDGRREGLLAGGFYRVRLAWSAYTEPLPCHCIFETSEKTVGTKEPGVQ
jgi:hypothetical protein